MNPRGKIDTAFVREMDRHHHRNLSLPTCRYISSSKILAYIIAVSFSVYGTELSFGAIKKVSYPEVKVEISKIHTPEPSFQEFWSEFGSAVANEDTPKLFSLVGPTFIWTIQGALAEDFDPGRDALHNFKVVFGFREHGSHGDGAVKNGPYWSALKAFTNDASFYKASGTTSMICGPIIAEATNKFVFERAQKSIAVDDDFGDWYFVAQSTPVTRSPNETAPIATLDKVAFPVLSVHQPENSTSSTHLEVLLPSGKSGWIAAGAARRMSTDQLCYAKNDKDRWAIVNFDQDED